MNKWLALLVLIVMIIGGWWLARTYARVTPPWRQPKFGTVDRGDIRVPISSPGLIEPAQRIEVKSKASGEVIAVNVQEGDFVRADHVLVVLKRDDEERALDRAKNGLVQAQVLLDVAKRAVHVAENNAAVTEAQLEEALARLISTQATFDNVERNYQRGLDSEITFLQAKSNLEVNRAQIEQLRAQVEIRKLSIEDAQRDIDSKSATVSDAEKQVEDAAERLAETEIRAPIDALVTDVMVRVGTIVQSGTGGFTGGTPILTLADISAYEVLARVDEADYGKVYDISPDEALPQIGEIAVAAAEGAEAIEKTGDVELYVDTYPEETFTGRIARVEPQGRQPTGAASIQYDVHVLITDERRRKLPLGAQAQVEFTVESVEQVLRVPADAVKSENEMRGLYIRTDEQVRPGEFGRRFIRCRFGITDGEYTQVVSCDEELREGQRVYTKLPPDPDDE